MCWVLRIADSVAKAPSAAAATAAATATATVSHTTTAISTAVARIPNHRDLPTASPFYLQTRSSIDSSSPLCLDPNGTPPDPYVELNLYTCEFDTPSTTDQLWRWEATNGGHVLVNVNNGVPCPSCAPPQCLGVDTSSAPFNLRLQDCVLGGALSSNMQAWSLDPDGLRTAADTLQCADASTHSPFSGVELLACSSEALVGGGAARGQRPAGELECGRLRWTCRCPDGATYQVGANNDNCETLACVGGEQIGQCQLANGPWSHQRALCAPPPEDALVADVRPLEACAHGRSRRVSLSVLLSVAAASAICLVLVVLLPQAALQVPQVHLPLAAGDTSQALLDENDVQMQNPAVESTVSTKSMKTAAVSCTK